MLRRSRLLLLAVLSCLAVTGCASLDTWQRRAIFQPSPFDASPWRSAPAGVEEFDIAVGPGEHVHAWYLTAADADAPTLLYLHGARRNLYGTAGRIERWRDMGFNVLAIDYRGFGRSSERLPSEQSAMEDTRAAYRELVRRQPDPGKRYVYGYSLGGAMAIDLAAHEDGLAGVILESTFTRIGDLVERSKWGWVPGLRLLVTQEFNSLARMERVNEPVLLLHGTADRIIPHEMADELAAAARSIAEPLRRVIKFEGASHWGIPMVAGSAYDAAVRDFLARAGSAATTAALGSGVSAAR